MSKADALFKETCVRILAQPSWEESRATWPDGTPARTKRVFGVVHRYDLQAEFPVLTLRKVPLELAVDEVLWIFQRRSNNVRDLGSRIWDAWADAEGSIGPAYGGQLQKVHEYPEGTMTQVDHLLYELRHNPTSRRMVVDLWCPQDLHAMALQPCAWSTTWTVTSGRLNCVLNQRSQDMLTANGWNVAQYAALVHLLAAVSGLEPGVLVHVVADAHVYDRHEAAVRRLVERDTYPAPTFRLNKKADFYDYGPKDFVLENYKYGPQVKFEVAV